MSRLPEDDWSQQLVTELKHADAEFQAFMAIKNGEVRAEDFENEEVQHMDPQANATFVAGAALASVLHALKQLPAFAAGRGLVALHSLSAAITTLDKGGRPDLLRPRPDTPGTRRHVGRDYVENHVLLCVDLLVAFDGRPRTSARKVVASLFSKEGHRARKSVDGILPPLSEKSIFEWEARLAESSAAQRRAWVTARTQSYLNREDWPPDERSLLTEIRRIAADPLLKTKI